MFAILQFLACELAKADLIYYIALFWKIFQVFLRHKIIQKSNRKMNQNWA